MEKGTGAGGKFTNSDHVRYMDSEWKNMTKVEKYTRLKEHIRQTMEETGSGERAAVRAGYERTLEQQTLLSIALATRERLPEIKAGMRAGLERCVVQLERHEGTGGTRERIERKLQKEYGRVSLEQGLIREAEEADKDPVVKAVRINKLIKLAEHERVNRPETYRGIRERAEELLETSEEFKNYRIFKRAYEETLGAAAREAAAERERKDGHGFGL